MTPAHDALERLLEGHRRFAAGLHGTGDTQSLSRRDEVARGQEPFAHILGCSNSRVPAEIVFAQGLGDLFVIRVAGNIVAPSQIGSVEFAAESFGIRLVVVLGHSECGAVRANVAISLAHLRHGSEILENLIQNDGLIVVGAEYSLETGEVEFFDAGS